jgi:hypothetical protein
MRVRDIIGDPLLMHGPGSRTISAHCRRSGLLARCLGSGSNS